MMLLYWAVIMKIKIAKISISHKYFRFQLLTLVSKQYVLVSKLTMHHAHQYTVNVHLQFMDKLHAPKYIILNYCVQMSILR